MTSKIYYIGSIPSRAHGKIEILKDTYTNMGSAKKELERIKKESTTRLYHIDWYWNLKGDVLEHEKQLFNHGIIAAN